MKKRTKKSAPSFGSFLNLVLDAERLEALGAESENVFTNEEIEDKENAKGFLGQFDDTGDASEYVPAAPKTETPKAEPDAVSSLRDFFK